MLGQKVKTLVDQRQTAGYYKAQFDAEGLTSGTYVYLIEAGDFKTSKTFTLIK
jgi:hypothetical protein